MYMYLCVREGRKGVRVQEGWEERRKEGRKENVQKGKETNHKVLSFLH